ncbi:MAG TPA: TIM barrel protein [Bryobacteraceae bacterium]|nr:TIM barrel protein [Bryobacteraceae bacterium]
MLTRRGFLSTTGVAAAQKVSPVIADKDDISLAAWSLNRSFFLAKRWKNIDLPRIAREEFNINGLEFVNTFFENPTMHYLQDLKKRGEKHGVAFVLIMVDGEGDMSAKDKQERTQAAIAHRKWVDIASFLGCKAIRCNMGGPRENWQQDADLVGRAAESFYNLVEYASTAELNILIENHGGASSDPDVVVSLMKTVDHPRFGTLPDFGNVNPGADHAEVIRKLAPFAKGVSVKAAWTAEGTHPGWDLEKLIGICRDAGYKGFWGIESSFGRYGRPRGNEETPPPPARIWQNEARGVQLTKAVLQKALRIA